MPFGFLCWLTRACVCSATLIVASALDLRSREIPDELWLFASPITGILTALWLYGEPYLLPLALLSLALAAVIAALIYYSGLTGGADAKALAFIAISMPLLQPEYFRPALAMHPFLPVASFSNALVFSVLYSIYLLAKNAYWRLSTGRPFFENVEGPLIARALVLIAGYKVRREEFLRSRFLFPLEAPAGGGKRKLILVARLDEERDRELREWLASVDEPEYIWVSPGLPFVVFLTAGFLMALLHGDVLFHALFKLLEKLLPP